MKLGTKAFSLTELMIVIVIIAIIFSAMAPIVTKRHVSENSGNESIWNFITSDPEFNSYFDPGDPKWTSSVYVGLIPSSAKENHGKLVINSQDITHNSKTYYQPQIQFRFSKDQKEQLRGVNTASLYVGNLSNIVFGPALSTTNTDHSTIYGISNLGNSGTSLPSAKYLTVMGHSAMGDAKITQTGKNQYIIAIGDSAAKKIGAIDTNKSANGIFIGSGAGSGLAEMTSPPDNNIAIGYNSMAYLGGESNNGVSGSNNVAIGVETGNTFSSPDASYNTIIGSSYVGETAAYNTIIGYGAYNKGGRYARNVTAIGYGACNSVNNSIDGSRVCIGYNSGVSTNNTPDTFNTDDGEHIFIGGKPLVPFGSRSFPGRSVLEVHNDGNDGNVVLNSNLVVRGNFYPSDGNNIAYNSFKTTRETLGSAGSAENIYYRCNNDSEQSLLGHDSYVCNGLVEANPKSINLLYKKGDCTLNGRYPSSNSNCPNVLSSDIRLKTDISENYDGLNKILELKPYKYRYKNDTKTPMVGVIAQDLQKIFPNAVSKDDKGFLKIRIEDMFFALVNAIKEISNKIDNIGEKVADLEQSITIIKNDQRDISKNLSLLDKRVKKLEKKWGVNGNN